MDTKRESIWAGRRDVVLRWRESGLSMAEFCRREGIGYTPGRDGTVVMPALDIDVIPAPFG